MLRRRTNGGRVSAAKTGVSTARHACHCGKSFAHKEHLTRHQATHGKPAYVCNVCQRQFIRKDVLRRHSILHEASHTRRVVSCDACRVNKTKCSGGTQCSLCARRGVNCTFRGGLHQSKKATTSEGSTSVNAPAREYDDNDDDADRELLPPNVEFLRSITILPSKPGTTSHFQPVGRGMEAIYELLVAEDPSLEDAVQDSEELQECVNTYLERYFKDFHLRWPILHAPTFEMEIGSASLPLAASVCVLGAWFQSSAQWTERFYALKVHEILLERLLHSVINPELMSGEKPWPIELFQAVILTLIFSLYHTDKSALFRAMLLRSSFITLLRELGAFNAESLADHLKTYYGGTYAPFTLSMSEKFKRVLIYTYQFDAYFALIHEKPPILHRQEVCVGLPSSFALWNTYGLDVFASRQPEEPPGRSELQVSEMASSPDSFTSSQILVEDVQLGLCGLLQAIWVLSQPSPSKMKEYNRNTFQRLLLIETLHEWKRELDKIDQLTDTRTISGNDARYLLLAYRGEDDSVAASLKRINTLVQDGMLLYYYLRMYHYASLGTSEVVGARQAEDPRSETWRTSKNGREALVCAFQILKIVELVGGSGSSVIPLIRHALPRGAKVTKVFFAGQKCECLTKGQHASSMSVQQWTEAGGPFWIDGTPVCICKLTFWTERFEKAIENQKTIVE